ncbi:glycosyltransferase family 2 protein [Antarcticibacterium flavum]|uniref:Glycosyltransferase family 2 protein n=1 Tax=Antarcticibacterium flavum TaxID=2058175 RepID=A0A5B7X3E6_9FLAO|nr:glycosyltransferase family A protein [Antarcticibacterium flavum]MCM4160480.1 glycosyl transferase family 2 [Antarcticibacterium sp. W02-3]QCY69222.1 glycosyltransferase family 2 protein [Antarcticibacterium flavum]
MRIYIVIPAHNEEAFIGQTLDSLINQSVLPTKIVVVDDQSTDGTHETAASYAENYDFITVLSTTTKGEHLPGSKVVNAFCKGLESLDENYDIICKFDADLIFPVNYLEKITHYFSEDPAVGMAGGFCTVEENGNWKLENLTSKDHIRGALKAYRKECFQDIGKLKPAMGWDTVDELLAQFHGWKVVTIEDLLVKHLKATGGNYNKAAKYKQGAAFYRLRYGFLITAIASTKLSLKKGKPALLQDYLIGFFKAKKEKQPFLVTSEEGRFIRNLRWKKMLKKVF